MPQRRDGSFYPAAQERKPNKKAQARLDARIAAWEQTIRGLPATENKNGWRKPGSNKK